MYRLVAFIGRNNLSATFSARGTFLLSVGLDGTVCPTLLDAQVLDFTVKRGDQHALAPLATTCGIAMCSPAKRSRKAL